MVVAIALGCSSNPCAYILEARYLKGMEIMMIGNGLIQNKYAEYKEDMRASGYDKGDRAILELALANGRHQINDSVPCSSLCEVHTKMPYNLSEARERSTPICFT